MPIWRLTMGGCIQANGKALPCAESTCQPGAPQPVGFPPHMYLEEGWEEWVARSEAVAAGRRDEALPVGSRTRSPDVLQARGAVARSARRLRWLPYLP